jgi:hypothetical protein
MNLVNLQAHGPLFIADFSLLRRIIAIIRSKGQGEVEVASIPTEEASHNVLRIEEIEAELETRTGVVVCTS